MDAGEDAADITAHLSSDSPEEYQVFFYSLGQRAKVDHGVIIKVILKGHSRAN